MSSELSSKEGMQYQRLREYQGLNKSHSDVDQKKGELDERCHVDRHGNNHLILGQIINFVVMNEQDKGSE